MPIGYSVRSAVMLIALLLAAAVPDFDPLRFFAGQTQGEGRLKVVLRTDEAVRVRGSGTVADGVLVLDQTVWQGKKPARSRQWRLKQVSPGRYEGTLTDARGPVTGVVEGSLLHLRFRSDDGFQVQQWLTLAPDGRSAANRLEARKFGMTVATLSEQITKID